MSDEPDVDPAAYTTETVGAPVLSSKEKAMHTRMDALWRASEVLRSCKTWESRSPDEYATKMMEIADRFVTYTKGE